MSSPVRYTIHHPRWYRQRVSVWWWLESWPYTRFVIRELSSLAVAYTSVILLWKLRAIAAGPTACAAFLAEMRRPLFVTIHVLALGFVLFHSMTWFSLAPKAVVMRLGGKRVPDWAIQAANFALWIACSGAVLWLAGRH
jgi:fumarate reductase subunit C